MNPGYSHLPGWPIYISLAFVLVLSLVSFGGWVAEIMPNLVMMVVVYWAIYRPDVMKMGMAWFVGIIHDALTVSMIGQHALIYVIIVFVLGSGAEKTRRYAFFEYMTWIVLFIVFDVLMSILFNRIFLQADFNTTALWSILAGTMIWPWLYVLLSYIENVATDLQQ